MKGNKSFYISSKGLNKVNVPLLNGTGDLVAGDTDKAEVLCFLSFFCSVITSEVS